jgi:hypothetical protein
MYFLWIVLEYLFFYIFAGGYLLIIILRRAVYLSDEHFVFIYGAFTKKSRKQTRSRFVMFCLSGLLSACNKCRNSEWILMKFVIEEFY